MPQHEQPWLRHQQQRWMRPDAHRWVRPDAARFLKPGTDPAEVYPALARKYSPNQPRIPAGRTGGGRWSREGEGGGGSPSAGVAQTVGGGESGDGSLSGDGSTSALGFAEPMGNIDFGDLTGFRDLSSTDDLSSLVHITVRPSYADDSGGRVQLAGDIPEGIGNNGGPALDPAPEIPQIRPETSAEVTAFLRAAGRWIGRAIGLGIAVDTYVVAINNREFLRKRRAEIHTYRDPPKTYLELMDAVKTPRPGTHVHHVAEQTALERFGFTRRQINAPENLVRIPTLRHYDITGWYGQPNEDYGGLTPREYLADKPLSERMSVGKKALILFEVMKP